MTKNSAKWEVSKTKNSALSKAHILANNTDNSRYETLSRSTLIFSDEREVILEIGKLWHEAQDRFLAIGRYLVQAKSMFNRTYEAKILPQLPFGKGVAYQLRAVATAVDEGRLLEDELPHSYATAYQLVSLSASELETARQHNLVRRDVLRRDVELFRINIRSNQKTDDYAILQKERKFIENKITLLTLKLNEIHVRIERLDLNKDRSIETNDFIAS